MFHKILVANRGEIACRIIRTARKIGIRSVAVFSDVDSDALHVREADEAIAIGEAPASQSYLAIEKIIAAARSVGADCVHPGYGFLSENTEFAKKLLEAGIAFIGPNPSAIAAMGDKIASKKLAEEFGVNIVPGYLAPIKDGDEAILVAKKIGFPVMMKASAGGGGKGMRIAHSVVELQDGFRAAVAEARSSFGDDRVFIEKYISSPRHIEMQIIADRHGNCIYLGERECSIQRRHQKVIEEAPSSFLDEKTRQAMGEQAVHLAKKVGYDSAGTVEFIVDSNRNFYFLEMNTRLQVEHPVTELVTGLDLVELMIRIAAGEELPFHQKDVKRQGWAMESRIYAEDPMRGFTPSIGRLSRYREPEIRHGLRIDSGVYEGSEIGVHYDPMIAKLITHGKDREEAIAKMEEALSEFHIEGLDHNIDFLQAVMRNEHFRKGEISTAFIAEEFPAGFKGVELSSEERNHLIAIAAFIHAAYDKRDASRPRHFSTSLLKENNGWVVRVDGENHLVSIGQEKTGYKATIGESGYTIKSDWRVGDPVFRGAIDGRPVVFGVKRKGVGYSLIYKGARKSVMVYSPRAAELARYMKEKTLPDMSRFLLSPMPGFLVSLAVKEGDRIKTGQELAIVEAMKMENLLRADRDGIVLKLHARAGDSVSVDQVLIEFQ